MSNMQTIITQETGKISCNFEQVESAIKEKLSEYEGAVFTEDSKNVAKKEVASLRAEKKSFQDNIREAKKKYMAPWDEFETQAKKLIGMYDEPINFIAGQVQAFEEKRIEEKRQLIKSIYDTEVPSAVKEYLSFCGIYNQKWENATYKEKDIKKEILAMVHTVEQGIQTISGMESEATEKALEMYKITLNLADSISYINNYERQKQEILAREQERKRREEEERIRREEREKIMAEQRAREEREAAERKAEEEKAAAVEQARAEGAQEAIDALIPTDDEESSLYEYRISLSADAKEKLEMYMDSVGIEWELI